MSDFLPFLKDAPFDKISKTCHSANMLRITKKFIAVLLAVWLPLFSGSALAESIVMQSKMGDCHAVVAQEDEHRSHLASIAHEHQAQPAEDTGMPSGHQEEPNPPCNSHSICHFASCGYVANSVLMTIAVQQPDRAFTPYLVTLRSLTLPLFDPPPLARA
ncbi:MAG: hypothetical protein Q7S46_03455 [Gallionella sp.]|nr:hypothetical protein [Gallionella sp.]